MYRQRYPDDPGMHNMGERRNTHIERAQTFTQRVGSSLAITVFGLVLIPAALFLLGWNEGRAVQTAQTLDEALATVTELRSSQVVEPQLNGRLVHVSDRISCDEILRDPTHGVAVSAVSLKRSVEMYQWVETEHREERELSNGDKEVSTTYSYNMVWRSDLVRSSQFDSSLNHRNPESMPFKSEMYKSGRVTLGAFTLSRNLMSDINQYHDLTPTVIPNDAAEVKLQGKYIYYSHNPQYPQVGDVRVSFSYSGLCKDSKLGKAQMVSVMGMQDGFTLTAYQTQSGGVLEMITLSHKSAYDMIRTAQSENTLLTWILRGVGLLLNFLGFTCLTSLLRTLVSYIPIVRELVYVSVVAFNVSLSLSLSLFTIAISWIIYRPVMAIGIIVLAISLIILPRLKIHPADRSRRIV